MSSESLSLSVVIPVRDERESVGPLLAEIVAALDGRIPFEVIFVDDGSSDGTGDVLAAQGGQYPMLRVIRHRQSCGQSTAIRTGVKAAGGEFIATLDGDGQNDPADIPSLWERLMADPAPRDLMVAGWRTKRHDTAWRRFQSRFANGIRGWMLKDGTPDTGCGLKLFSRSAFLDLPYFDHMHRFLPALMIRRGGRVVSVPVNHRHRERGVSKYGMWGRALAGIVDLAGMVWLLRRARRPEITGNGQ